MYKTKAVGSLDVTEKLVTLLAADAQDQMDYREYFNRRCGMPAKDKGGDERFIFGSKISQTFRQVASYHLRCYAAGYNPIPIQMDRYCKYFAEYGRQHAAAGGMN